MTLDELLIRVRVIADGSSDEEMDALLAKIKGFAGDAKAATKDSTAAQAAAWGVVGAAAAGAFGKIVEAVKTGVDASNAYKAAVQGLSSVSAANNIASSEMQAALDAVTDKFFDATAASTAFKNLLSRGYTLDQATQSITRLKDAAAFGRQSSYSLRDAVVSATEGLKNENSILVDNAGVTKNVSQMWKEYAKSRGISTESMTQSMKVEAEYLGIMKETAAQVGDIGKLSEGLAGAQAEAANQSTLLARSFGEAMTPMVEAGTEMFTGFLGSLTGISEAAPGVTSAVTTMAGAFTGITAAVAGIKALSGLFGAGGMLMGTLGPIAAIAGAVGLLVGVLTGLEKEQEKQRKEAEETLRANQESAKGYADNATKIREYAKEYGQLRHKQRSSAEETRFLQLQTELAGLLGTTTDAIYAQAGSLDAWAQAAESAAKANAQLAADNYTKAFEQQLETVEKSAEKVADASKNVRVFTRDYADFGKAFDSSLDKMSGECKTAVDERMNILRSELTVKGIEVNQSVWDVMEGVARASMESAFETIDFDAGKEEMFSQASALVVSITDGLMSLVENPEFLGAATEQTGLVDRVLWGKMTPDEAVTAATENIETMQGLSEAYFESLGVSAEAASEKTDKLLNDLLGDKLTGQGQTLKDYFDKVADSGKQTSEAFDVLEASGIKLGKTYDQLCREYNDTSAQKKAVREWKALRDEYKKMDKGSEEANKTLKKMTECLGRAGIEGEAAADNLDGLDAAMAGVEASADTAGAGFAADVQGMIGNLTNLRGQLQAESAMGGIDNSAAIAAIDAVLLMLNLLSEGYAANGISVNPSGKGGGGGGKKKDEAEEAAKKAEEARKEAIKRDYDYIDHKRHLNEITLEEELALLEKIRVNHQLNAEEIMDWERKVYDLKKELRERDEESIDKLGDSVVDALEARYEAMRDAELDRLDESRKAWEQWRDDSVKAIEDQIAALDKLADTEDREKKDAEELRKIAKIKQDIEFEQDAYSRMKLQQQLDAAIAAREERLRRLELEDQKEALRDQIKDIEEKADKELDLIDKEEEKIDAAYEERLKEAALRAEAEKLILTKNQDELLALLKEYAPEYDALGKTLGEKLADGFAQKVGDIAKWFENFNSAMINFQNQVAAEITGTMDSFQAEHQKRQEAGAVSPTVVNQTVQFYEPVETPNQVARRMEQVNEELGQMFR